MFTHYLCSGGRGVYLLFMFRGRGVYLLLIFTGMGCLHISYV